MTRPRVLVFAPFFLPSEQGGGLVRAVDYLIQHLHGDFEFVVATSERDLRETTPYGLAARDAARARAGVDIRYLPETGRWKAIRALLAEGFDLVYLNSFLSRGFSLLPLLARQLTPGRRPPVLLAPRGELMAGALQHKRLRKHIYLRLLMATRLLRGVALHATSVDEAHELHQLGLGEAFLAADLPPRHEPSLPALESSVEGAPLRVVFAARIDPKKNLRAAIAAVALARHPLQFDIIGPVGDEAYWAGCQPLLAALPAHVQARYLGGMAHADLMRELAKYELLLLPTLAENNGYIILEALLAGCALLISDTTPWRGLSGRDVGWDLPLGDTQRFVKALDSFASLTPQERLQRREAARQFGLSRLSASADVLSTREMLLAAVAQGRPADGNNP